MVISQLGSDGLDDSCVIAIYTLPFEIIIHSHYYNKEDRTRGHEVVLVEEQCRLDIRNCLF